MREMKDSGVEWIGEIPADWQVRKIKHLATLAGRIGWQGLTLIAHIFNILKRPVTVLSHWRSDKLI